MRILSFLERFLTIIFWILIMFGFDTPYIALLTLLSAIIHEAGHMLAFYLICKRGIKIPRGVFTGFRIDSQLLSFKEEIISAAFGPLANLAATVTVSFFSIFSAQSRGYFETFALVNLLTMFSNIIPIEGYDGYRILSSTFSLVFKDPVPALKILWNISFILTALFSFVSLYIMLKIGEGYWIFAVSLSLMLSLIFKKQKHMICEEK